MGLRERMFELTQVEELDEFLVQYPTGAIFKAGTCHKTTQTFGYVEEALNPYEEIHMAFVRVVESRPVSNLIAEKTGIVHQSPQFILFVNGKPVYHVDNWNITLQVVEQALQQHLGPAKKGSACAGHSGPSSDVSVYVNLLKDLIQERLAPAEFERRWLTTFQLDATPRSTHEFEMLNSLFGDVDAALSGGENQEQLLLKKRAADLLHLLSA